MGGISTKQIRSWLACLTLIICIKRYVPQEAAINLPTRTAEVTGSWLCLVFNPINIIAGFLADTQSNKGDGSKPWFYHVVKATGDGPEEDSSVKGSDAKYTVKCGISSGQNSAQCCVLQLVSKQCLFTVFRSTVAKSDFVEEIWSWWISVIQVSHGMIP